MESVIQVVRGQTLESSTKECVFCSSAENTTTFGIITKKTHDGLLFKSFPVCQEHLLKLNALLSGDFDIDQINLETYRKPAGKAVRFRG